MPSLANLSIRNLYASATEFLSAHSPTWSTYAQYSPVTPGENSPTSAKENPEDSASLRDRLDAACPTPTTATSFLGFPTTAMRRELDVTKHELAKSKAEVARLEERCKMLEKTLKETRELLKVRDTEVDKLRKERERQRLLGDRRHSDPQASPTVSISLPHSRHSTLDLRHHSSASRLINGYTNPNEFDDTVSLAASTTSEETARSRVSEIYLTRTDSWSGAQVIQAVHDINSEIIQFAASAIDLCSFDKNSRPSSARSVQAMHDTSARLGPNLARILSNRDHSQDPILVQLALQGCVAMCVATSLSAFCVGFPSKSDAVFSQLYARIAFIEPQPTSSKWRALAHRYIHMNYPHLAERSVTDLCDTILRWCSDIFVVAGCTTYEAAQGHNATKNGLRGRFNDQVRRIAKSVIRLARVTREEIMSTCFDVIAVNQNDMFDPKNMSDTFANYVPSRGPILATMELGLRCTTRSRDAEPYDNHGNAALEQRILLKPKVVLESVLDALDPR